MTTDIKCGTDRGYMKHRKEKTPTCIPCREAHTKQSAASKARKRKRLATMGPAGFTRAMGID